MKSICFLSFVSLLIFTSTPCSAQKASTLHTGVTPSTLHVGITPSTLHVGISPSMLYVGITPSTLNVGISPSTLYVGVVPSRLHIVIEPALDIFGVVYPTFVPVSPATTNVSELFPIGVRKNELHIVWQTAT